MTKKIHRNDKVRNETAPSRMSPDWKTSPTSARPSPPICAELGISMPAELPGRDPYAMYDDLCQITGRTTVNRKATPSLIVGKASFVRALVDGCESCSGTATAAVCRNRSKPISTACNNSSLEG